MMFRISNIRYWCSVILCTLCLYGSGANVKTVKLLVSATGDEATLNYQIEVDGDQVIIKFGCIDDLRLGDTNSKKYHKIDDERMKVIFMDGRNLDKEVEIVEAENGIIWDCITTPDSWNYQQTSGDHVFCLNNKISQPKIIFTGNQNQRFLKIPVYLAHAKTEGKRKYLVAGEKRYKTTYHIISEFEPVEIELPVPKTPNISQSNASSSNRREVRVVVDSTVIDPVDDPIPQESFDSGGSGNQGGSGGSSEDATNNAETIAKYDAIVNKKLSELENRLDSCKSTPQIDVIDHEYQGLKQSYENNVSPEVKEKLTDFDTKISNKRDEIKPIEEKWKWIKRIIAGLCAILAALGFHKLQNIRNAKNLKGLEDMQQKMVRRAENEAKRRAQSVARNKAHQMVGKAKQKGRQAARSGASELGDRIRGKKSGNSTPVIGNAPSGDSSNRPSIGRFANKRPQSGPRRSKPGDNGEISI